MRLVGPALLAAVFAGGCDRRAAEPRDGGGPASGARPDPSPPSAVAPPAPDPPRPAPPSRPVVRAAGTVIGGWGTVVDPDRDCVVREHPGWVSITVPNAVHEINPRKEKPNAPLVLHPVTGDFRAVVRVTGEFVPNAPSNSRLSPPFHGAGLVLWEDEKNFLLIARNCWTGPGGTGGGFCYPPLFELFEDGQPKNTNPPVTLAAAFHGDSTALYLERRGDTVRGAFSHDGKTWEGWRETAVRLPRAAKVGVAAVNTAAKPFVVAFDGFKMLDE